MKFTIDWLKEHLDTKLNDQMIIDKLTNIGLEVESFESQQSEFDQFIVAKIINTEKHPNADRLSLCDVDIGQGKTVKVVCGAPNAKKNLYTVYAPPGALIPKSQTRLAISKIRGVTSYGMLCSESELKLSNESDGIIDLSSKKYTGEVGKKYFANKKELFSEYEPFSKSCLNFYGNLESHIIYKHRERRLTLYFP